MKNLYDRLRKEHKYQLELNAIQDPALVDQIIEGLRNYTYVLDLPLHMLLILKSAAGVDLDLIFDAFSEGEDN